MKEGEIMKMNEMIRKLRKEKGMTQSDLAELVGYTERSSIARIEKGDVDIPSSKISAFAKVFGISEFELLGFLDEKDGTETAERLFVKEMVDRLSQEQVHDLRKIIEIVFKKEVFEKWEK